jgi:hypothetical protein
LLQGRGLPLLLLLLPLLLLLQLLVGCIASKDACTAAAAAR